jgi:hypothetical protein
VDKSSGRLCAISPGNTVRPSCEPLVAIFMC